MFKKVSAIFLALTMVFSLFTISAPVVGATAQITDLIPFSTFDSDGSDLTGWSFRGTNTGTIEWTADATGGYLKILPNASGNPIYYAKALPGSTSAEQTLSAKINGQPIKIVGKAYLNFIAGGTTSNDLIEFGVSRYENERLKLVRISGSPTVSLHRGIKVNSAATNLTSIGKNSGAANGYIKGDWIQSIYVIDVDASGNGIATYYVNGKKFTLNDSGAPFAIANIGASDALTACVDVKGAVTSAIDNIGMYTTTEAPAFTAESINNSSNIALLGDVVINFSNEIYKDAFTAGSVTINGEAVDVSRFSVGADQKSLIIKAPDTGYESGITYSVGLSDSILDIFGTALSPSALSFTTSSSVPFFVNDFNGGVTENVALNAEPTIAFSTPVNSYDLEGKIQVNGTDVALENIVQVDANTIKITGLSLNYESTYNVALSADAVDADGATISGTLEFSFNTVVNPALYRYQDFSSYTNGDSPTDKDGFYYANKPNKTIETIDGKNYLRLNANNTDQNFGVRASQMLKYYDGKVRYNTRLKFDTGSISTSHTRIRMNYNDTNQVNLLLFSKVGENDGIIGLLNYDGSAGNLAQGQNWTYQDDVWYDITLDFDLGEAEPKLSVYINGENGDSYKYENIDMDLSKTAFSTGPSGDPITVASQITDVNGIYIYSNGASNGGQRNNILIDETSLKIAPQAANVASSFAGFSKQDVENGELTATFNLSNTNVATKYVTVILAQYEGTVQNYSGIKNISIKKVPVTVGAASKTASSSINITDSANSFIKAMVLDLNTMQPIHLTPAILE